MSTNKILVLLLIVMGILTAATLWADSADDCVVSGNLKINGQDAFPGTTIEAYIDGQKIVSTTTTETGQYEITIPKKDPYNPTVRGYQSTSDIVTIKVNNSAADPDFNPTPGTLKINLEVNTSLNVKLTTWGKIKALFK